MEGKITHQFINWKTGMQVSVDHFLALENAVIDRVRDSHETHLTSFNYGLVRGTQSNFPSLRLEVIQLGSRALKVEMTHCRCVTRAGNRIEIHPGVIKNPFIFEIQSDDFSQPGNYYLTVGVQAFGRREVGEVNPDEPFRRHPYTQPVYDIKILSENEIFHEDFHLNYLPLLRIAFDKFANLKHDNAYIPPCMAVSSHELMMQELSITETYKDSLLSLVKELFDLSSKVIAIIYEQHENHSKFGRNCTI
ncbi:MAG: hypothetical protein AAFR59_17400 [Bacteroidota bacterium]